MRLLTASLAIVGLISPSQALRPGTTLREVHVASQAGVSTVVIEADGPLPAPVVGVVGDPARIYLDFPGVTPATRGTAVALNTLVRRVRVALHQPEPLVTRLVIDLTKPAPHRLEAARRQLGELTVIVGDAPVSTAGGAKERPAAVSPADARQRAATLAALEQLERLKPVLVSIDTRAALPEEILRTTGGEFEAIRVTLSALRPPRELAPTHEVLVTVCVLGTRAVETRLEAQQRADDASTWNAASAAAGALILLDRAARELRSVSVPE